MTPVDQKNEAFEKHDDEAHDGPDRSFDDPVGQRCCFDAGYAERDRIAQSEIAQRDERIDALEGALDARDTCVVCQATLLPERPAPPHCVDCHPTDDDEIDYEERQQRLAELLTNGKD
jgi:hypothetical protein